jgi:hypothetical protein
MTSSSQPKPLTKEICLHIAQSIKDGFGRYAMEIGPHSDIAVLIRNTLWLANRLDISPEQLSRKELDRWVRAFLCVQQGKNISFVLDRLVSTQIPREKLQILRKRLDYLSEKGDSHAPDIFFEMEVAARVCRYYPGWNVYFEEPDLIMEYPEGRAALCCKRVKSERKLPKRLIEAAEQGAKAKVPFFVIVDVQELFEHFFGGRILRVSTQDALSSACSGFLDTLIVRHAKSIAAALGKGAGGVILRARCIGLVDKPSLSLCWCLKHKSCPNLGVPAAGSAIGLLVELMEE